MGVFPSNEMNKVNLCSFKKISAQKSNEKWKESNKKRWISEKEVKSFVQRILLWLSFKFNLIQFFWNYFLTAQPKGWTKKIVYSQIWTVDDERDDPNDLRCYYCALYSYYTQIVMSRRKMLTKTNQNLMNVNGHFAARQFINSFN